MPGDLRVAQRLDRFLALAAPGGAILDLGCGTGEPIVRYLIERGRAVVGVDASPTMIGLCRERFPDQEWIVADMRTVAPGRRFDGVMHRRGPEPHRAESLRGPRRADPGRPHGQRRR